MPRRARLNLTDVPQHIIQRGNNRQVTFFAEEAYRELFRSELDPKEITEFRDTVNKGWPLGSERFKDDQEIVLAGLHGTQLDNLRVER